LGGAAVLHGERESRLEWLDGRAYERVPIAMVASGPKSIRLAARQADLVALSVGCAPERIGWALAHIRDELDICGRPPDELTIGTFVPMAVASDRSTARGILRQRAATWAHMSSYRGNDLGQQPDIMRRVTSRLRDSYDYRYHGPKAKAANVNSDAVDEDFADWFGLGGPPSYLLERLAELVELGISHFSVVVQGEERDRFAADVMPALRSMAS
jgi:alkanesulfonate monooxygenase SsuD/methylene tetrahydromethanopterin reductase-like flavin-dependent oxidoreductase (luciferase family)